MSRKSDRYRRANPVPISRFVSSLVDQLGLGQGLRFDQVKRNWQDIVGPANARNTTPLELKDRTLVVAVSSPAWMTQARFYKKAFLEKINANVPEHGFSIDDVQFVLDRPNRRTE